jgi:hypothetical protein
MFSFPNITNCPGDENDDRFAGSAIASFLRMKIRDLGLLHFLEVVKVDCVATLCRASRQD